MSVVIAVCFVVAFYKNHHVQTAPAVFLVTGDFRKGADFSHDVLKGAELAMGVLPPGMVPNPLNIISLDTGGSPSEQSIRAAFLDRYTNNKICAVISADISAVAPIIVKTATSYGVPVLLTVATSDDVLPQRRGDRAFRLVPRDTRQADLFAKWLAVRAKPAIIHGGQTPYGRFLAAETVDRFSRISSPSQNPILTTEYVLGTDLFSSLIPLKAVGVDAIVFIGYSDRFREFYAKLRALEMQPAVLLSDGCYTPELLLTPPEGDFALSFPVDPKRRPDGTQGNGIFGYDASILLAYTLSEMNKKSAVPSSFATEFRRAATNKMIAHLLLSKYHFDNKGENIVARFDDFPLHLP